MLNDVRDLIDAFGGPAAVADAIHGIVPDERPVSRGAIYNWQRRGIPPRCHLPLLVAAERAGIELSVSDLLRLAAASSPPSHPGG